MAKSTKYCNWQERGRYLTRILCYPMWVASAASLQHVCKEMMHNKKYFSNSFKYLFIISLSLMKLLRTSLKVRCHWQFWPWHWVSSSAVRSENCCPAQHCPCPELRKVCCLPSPRQNKIKENRCNSILSNTGLSVQPSAGWMRSGVWGGDNIFIPLDYFCDTNDNNSDQKW